MWSPLGCVKCGSSTLTDLAASFYFFLSLLSNLYCTPTGKLPANIVGKGAGGQITPGETTPERKGIEAIGKEIYKNCKSYVDTI